MTPAERLHTLQRGLVALRAIEARRRAALPSPERPDVPLLRELRDVATLADRLAMELDIDGLTPHDILARDASLSMAWGAVEGAFLEALATDTGAGTPYRDEPPPAEEAAALRALAALLARYEAREFLPPMSYFGIAEAET